MARFLADTAQVPITSQTYVRDLYRETEVRECDNVGRLTMIDSDKGYQHLDKREKKVVRKENFDPDRRDDSDK